MPAPRTAEPVVRPEFGPSLSQLLGPRLRRLPRVAQAALAVLAALVVVLVAVRLVQSRAGDDHPVLVRSPVAFTFIFRTPFVREAPQGGELVRVGTAGQQMTVRELRLAAYRGDVAGALPDLASQLSAQMARRYDGYVLRQEGRTNVNQQQGYELVFQFRRAGRLSYGRRVLLVPGVRARQGADILLTAQRTAAVPQAAAVARNGGLKVTLRSFRFGTARP